MELFISWLESVNSFVWGPVMLFLLLGTGIYLTVGLRFISITKIPIAFKYLWKGRKKPAHGKGEISAFNALMTSLAATIGTGNIAGVATAIFMGGPGALFWMWATALVGMATKFAEVALAVRYREVTPEKNWVGGPMYFIKNGLSSKWTWLGTSFAVFGAFAGFGIGNTVQANSIADALNATFSIPTWVTAVLLFVLVGAVLLGGLQRIGVVAGKLVPTMTVFYMSAAILVVLLNISAVPDTLALVFAEAFTPTAAQGGFAGATVWLAIRFGVARGVFSNEAGLGSAPIAMAAATSDSPIRTGFIGMLGTFIDTIIVCSLTGFAILVTNTWTSGLTGASLTTSAFESALPGIGGILVTIGIALFAFTTILGWCVYSERCVIYLIGDKGLKPFRLIYTLAVPIGAIAQLDTVWLLADTLNALMAIPNLIGILLLSPELFRMIKAYMSDPNMGLQSHSGEI